MTNELGFSLGEAVLLLVILVQSVFLVHYHEKAARLEKQERDRVLAGSKKGGSFVG